MFSVRVVACAAILVVALALTVSCPRNSETAYREAFRESSTAQAAETDPAKITVYVTKTGAKYHLAGCKYLAKSRSSISLKDAKAKGYKPCTVCNPPK